jgi:ERCC4-type nuclease
VSSVAVTIVVDRGELRSGVPDALRSLGVAVQVAACDAADYLVGDGIGVERKTVKDLHRSVATGRLWNQLLRCRESLDRTYLLVEGDDLDYGCLTVMGVRGALLEVGDRGVTVLRSADTQDSAAWLARISARLQRRPRARPHRRRFPAARSSHSVLSQVPGIGPATARRLLEHFGSIGAVAGADLHELESVEGVGPHRASVLVRILSESP